MTLATLKGRLQTKLATYVILAAVTGIFVWMEDVHYLSVFAVAAIVGLILEAIWGYFIVHEPGWLTITLGGVEFVAIAAVATLLDIPIGLDQAFRYYLVSWLVIQLFVIYLLPVWRLQYSSEGSELY